MLRPRSSDDAAPRWKGREGGRKEGRKEGLETHDRLADESQSLEGVDPQPSVLGVSNELKEDFDELWPLSVGEFDDGDG